MIAALLEYGGAALGLAGAWLVASDRRDRRRLAFLLWLVSNAALITWAATHGAWGLTTMQAAFLVTSVRGYIANR